MLRFSPANAKLKRMKQNDGIASFLAGRRKIYSLDLLSGHSCPFAQDCLSKVIVDNGKRKIQDGPHTKFRCFSASQEVLFPDLYNLRSGNFTNLRQLSFHEMVKLIESSLPPNLGVCRLHVGGDFFNPAYFYAWVNVARNHSDRLFYAYTKSLSYWMKHRSEIPDNLVLTASYGGRLDNLISLHGLRYSKVVYSEPQAEILGLEIDHDDSHAADPQKRDQSFALLVHGTQPKGSEASQALQLLRKNEIEHSYGR